MEKISFTTLFTFTNKKIYVKKIKKNTTPFSFRSKIQKKTKAPKRRDICSAMSHYGDDNPSEAAEDGYDTEFRYRADDAWYSVRVILEGELGEVLRVKYDNFPDNNDNVFIAESFKSEEELYEFIARFRKVSAQLQDQDCSKVVKGNRVCASDSFGHDDVHFYDAIVDGVGTTNLI